MKKLLVIIFGIIFIGAGIFSIVKGNELVKKCTVETTATVIQLKEESSSDSDGLISYTYYPIIEYKVGERTITEQGITGSNPSKYNINDKVEILYNPDKAEEFIIKGDSSSNWIGIIFIVVGVVVIIAGILKKN